MPGSWGFYLAQLRDYLFRFGSLAHSVAPLLKPELNQLMGHFPGSTPVLGQDSLTIRALPGGRFRFSPVWWTENLHLLPFRTSPDFACACARILLWSIHRYLAGRPGPCVVLFLYKR